jgi:hypothetical protein
MQPVDHSQQGGFAGAGPPDNPDKRPFLDLQRDVCYRGLIAKASRQTIDLEHPAPLGLSVP